MKKVILLVLLLENSIVLAADELMHQYYGYYIQSNAFNSDYGNPDEKDIKQAKEKPYLLQISKGSLRVYQESTKILDSEYIVTDMSLAAKNPSKTHAIEFWGAYLSKPGAIHVMGATFTRYDETQHIKHCN